MPKPECDLASERAPLALATRWHPWAQADAGRDFHTWRLTHKVSPVTVLRKLTRTVWVGFVQLDEYDESISVHDKVDWQVSALYAGFLDGVLAEEPPVDFELDRYARVMGLARAPLSGVVIRIRWLEYLVSTASGGAPAFSASPPAVRSVYSTSEPMGRGRQDRSAFLVQRGRASPGFGGFVVDVVIDNDSQELESLRTRLPDVPSRPWSEPM